MLRIKFGHSVLHRVRMITSNLCNALIDISFRTLFPTKERSDAGRGPLTLVYAAVVACILVVPAYSADGVFTNLRATNLSTTNLDNTNLNNTNLNTTNLSATNLSATYFNYLPVVLDCTSASKTYTLPASGARFILRIGDSDKTATIVPSVIGQTIMGSSSFTLELDGETVELFLIGSIWYRR